MKNIKYTVIFLLFPTTMTTLPALSVGNVLDSISFGISITYEADGFFEPGDITVKCGPSNSLIVYDSFKERETAAKIVVLKQQMQQSIIKDKKIDKQIIRIDQEIEKLFNQNKKKINL